MTLVHRVLFLLYEALWACFLLGWVIARGVRGGEWRRDIAQRLGNLPARPHGAERAIWLHAVSVGELLSIQPIIAEIKRQSPRAWILLTTSNDAAFAMATTRGTKADALAYTPWDASWCIARALSRVRPDVLGIVECEIWPNLIMKTARIAPVIMINARIYERDFSRYLATRWIFHPVLAAMTYVGTQSAVDRDRFLMLGTPANRVSVGGNSKFDVPINAASAGDSATRTMLGLKEGPVWIWASTHDDEEKQLLAPLETLRHDFPDLRVIIAPRDITRVGAIATQAEALGLVVRLRTKSPGMPSESACDILVLDTLGELASLMELADLVFIGGSLVAKGGHNPIEAARLGKPVLMGRHTRNFDDIVQKFVDGGNLIIVDDAESAGTWAGRLLADPKRRHEMGAAGRAVVDRERGVASRYANRLLGIEIERSQAA